MAEFWFKVYYILYFPLTAIFLLLIWVYRLIIRHGMQKSCHFLPTCSEYGFNSILNFGAIWGLVLTVKRILKCTPKNKAGLDLPKLNLLGNYKWKC